MKTFFKTTILLIILITTTSSSIQKIFHVNKTNYKLYSKEQIYKKGHSFDYDFDKDGIVETIYLDKDQIGFKIIGIQGDYGYDLHSNIYDIDWEYWDEDEDLYDNVYIQISHYDLDSDGKEELIISIADMSDCHSLIYKVRRCNNQPFIHLGTIEGQTWNGMHITDDNHIICPIGSQGIFSEYYIYKDRLVELNY